MGFNQEFQNGFFSVLLRELFIQGSNGRQGFFFLLESQSGLSVIASTVPLTNFFVPVPSFFSVCDVLDDLVFFCVPENILGIDQPSAIAEEAENEITSPSNTTHILLILTKGPFLWSSNSFYLVIFRVATFFERRSVPESAA